MSLHDISFLTEIVAIRRDIHAHPELAFKETRTADIVARENELIADFKKKGLNIIQVNADEFRDAVVKNFPFEPLGYLKSDWDRIQKLR